MFTRENDLSVMTNSATFAAVHRPLLDAETLPNWCYNSEEFYRLEVERIFRKSWNFCGRTDSIPNCGDYITDSLAGSPFIIVRNNEGHLRAFANTCRHRGARIANGFGKCRNFVCPYHGWVYDLDGALKACS